MRWTGVFSVGSVHHGLSQCFDDGDDDDDGGGGDGSGTIALRQESLPCCLQSPQCVSVFVQSLRLGRDQGHLFPTTNKQNDNFRQHYITTLKLLN